MSGRSVSIVTAHKLTDTRGSAVSGVCQREMMVMTMMMAKNDRPHGPNERPVS